MNCKTFSIVKYLIVDMSILICCLHFTTNINLWHINLSSVQTNGCSGCTVLQLRIFSKLIWFEQTRAYFFCLWLWIRQKKREVLPVFFINLLTVLIINEVFLWRTRSKNSQIGINCSLLAILGNKCTNTHGPLSVL
jgi:hypothetical protein